MCLQKCVDSRLSTLFRQHSFVNGVSMSDDIKEHCGLFGVFNHPEAARLTFLGLYALQHRGEEAAGIVVSDGQTLRGYKGMGLVDGGFTEQDLAELRGTSAIGHTRYSTTGSSQLKNPQPLSANYS